MYHIVVFNGFLQFYCNDLECIFNDKKGLCRMKYDYFPEKIVKDKIKRHKKAIKCLYDE